MKIIINVFQSLLLPLSYIVPRNDRLMAYADNNLNNSIYLIRHAARQSDGIRHVYITPYQTVIERLNAEGIVAVKRTSLLALWVAFRAGTYIISSSTGQINNKLARHATVVNLWHGISVKKIAAMEYRSAEHLRKKLKRYADIAFFPSTSPLTQQCFMQAFGKTAEQTPILGEPRNDFLVSNKHQRLDKLLLEYLNVNPAGYRKVIAYMPTWRDYGRWQTGIDFPKLNGFLAENDALLIIKPHPKDRTFDDDPDLSNIRYIKRAGEWQDAYEILAATDILVTDYSSLAYEYILTEKPVILYTPDIDQFRSQRDFWIDFLEVAPTNPIGDFPSLIAALKQAFSNNRPDERYLQVLDMLHTHKDARSSMRIYERIKSLKHI